MQNSNTKLIVGLGNPGKLYVNNRHNVGFRCIDFFARKEGIVLNQRRSRSRLGVGEVAGTRVILAKPRTFMNLSGQAVAPLLRYYQIQLQGLIVTYDDLDLPLGKIRIREHGGAGGHNGIKSIIGHLGRQDFARIRVGIAPLDMPASRETRTPEYVLGDFSSEERATIRDVYPWVAAAIRCLIEEGVAAAMNKYN